MSFGAALQLRDMAAELDEVRTTLQTVRLVAEERLNPEALRTGLINGREVCVFCRIILRIIDYEPTEVGERKVQTPGVTLEVPADA